MNTRRGIAAACVLVAVASVLGCTSTVELGPLADGTTQTMRVRGGTVLPTQTERVAIQVAGVGANVKDGRMLAFHTFAAEVRQNGLVMVKVFDVTGDRERRLVHDAPPRVNEDGVWSATGPEFVVGHGGGDDWLNDGHTDLRVFRLEFTFRDGVTDTLYQAARFDGRVDGVFAEMRRKF